MANIFSGLENLGIAGLSAKDIFGIEKEKEEEKRKSEVTKEQTEADVLLDKSYTCPFCGHNFKNKAVRSGKIRLASIDMDLKQNYNELEPLKYDVVSCNHCGFTAVSKFFLPLTPVARQLIKEKIASNFKPTNEPVGLYTYDLALDRYKLALANSIVKNAKASEKAYTCLRAGWLCRSYAKSLEDKDDKYEELCGLEKEFLGNAYEGFAYAVTKESFPMCGMDEQTVNYLISALAYELGKYEEAGRMITKVLTSPSAAPRTKDRARDLKDMIIKALKEQKS